MKKTILKTFLLTLLPLPLLFAAGCTPGYVGMYKAELPEAQQKQAEAMGLDMTLDLKKDKTFEMKVMNQSLTGTYSVEEDQLTLTVMKANDKPIPEAERAKNQPPPLTIEKDGSLTMPTPVGMSLKFKKQ